MYANKSKAASRGPTSELAYLVFYFTMISWLGSVSLESSALERSHDLSQSMRGYYLGHVITLNQWEASIQVRWAHSTNERPVSMSRDRSRPGEVH